MPDTDALRALATERGGYFTPADALACGWTDRAVEKAVSHGHWRRLYPGALADTAWLESLTPEGLHLVLLRARLGVLPDGWHAARRSAAVVHGLPLIGRVPAVPQLVRDRVVPSLRGRSRHERVAPFPSVDRAHRGVPVTSVARTVVDLARAESFRNGVVVADAALRAGASPAELQSAVRRATRWPGIRRARQCVAFADGRAETPLESISRVAFEVLGLPPPEPQVEIWCSGVFVARVDFLWRSHLLVGEADGRSKYGTVDDFYAEKRREEGIRDLGLEVVRWDWDAAYRPGPALRAVVERGLQRGSLNTLAPGVVLRSTAASHAAAA